MLLWLKKTTPESPGNKNLLSRIHFFYFVQWEYLQRRLKMCCLKETKEQSTEKENSCMNSWQALATNRVLNKECFKLLPWAMCLYLGSSW